MKLLKLLLLFLISGVSVAKTIEPAKIFDEANTLYNQKNYEAAIDKYETLTRENYESEAVYFNLGNAYYQLRKIAPSIYNYKKAMQINPDNAATKTNLKFADKMKLDTFETKFKINSNQAIHNLIRFFNHNQWAYVAIIFSVLILISFLIFYFKENSSIKKLFFSLQIAFGFLTLLSLAAAYFEKNFEDSQRFAIVFNEEVSLKVEPRISAKNVEIIHEGTEVFIEEETTKWYKITLPNQVSGWIEKNVVKEL